jgi:hypothetical protein
MNEPKFAALTLAVKDVISRRGAFWAIAGGIWTSIFGFPRRQVMAAKRVPTGGGFNGAACFVDRECNGGLCQRNGKCRKRIRPKHLTIIKRTGKCRCACKPGNSTCSQSVRQGCDVVFDDISGKRRTCYCRAGSDATICGDVELASCVSCSTDADCVAETGPGSVCAPAVGDCGCENGSPTTCVPPCGAELALR